MWLMKTLLTSRCINQRGAGHYIFNSSSGFAEVNDVITVDKVDYYTHSEQHGFHGIYYKMGSKVVYDCVYIDVGDIKEEKLIPAWEIVGE